MIQIIVLSLAQNIFADGNTDTVNVIFLCCEALIILPPINNF